VLAPATCGLGRACRSAIATTGGVCLVIPSAWGCHWKLASARPPVNIHANAPNIYNLCRTTSFAALRDEIPTRHTMGKVPPQQVLILAPAFCCCPVFCQFIKCLY
jgi:hypothetical protein